MQRHLRLRNREDFAVLRAEGKTCQHRLCVLSYRPNGLTHNRYGFIVVKRLGTAVVRNHIRRHLREAIRQQSPQGETGVDMVFIARNPITTATYAEIGEAVATLLKCVQS